MEAIKNIRITLSSYPAEIRTLYQQMIQWFIGMSGYQSRQVQLAFWIILDLIILLWLAIPLHRHHGRKRLKAEKASIEQIDKMIYLLAKNQYFLNLDQKTLGGDPTIALMKSIFEQGKKDYLKSTQLILNNIKKVEQLLGKEVIKASELQYFLQTFKRYQKQKKREKFWKRISVILSLGIYLIFA